MNREELDDYIDENITNKTADASVSPVNVGVALKEVADYADQEIKAKVLKREISHAELLTIFTAPITLLPAVSGKAYIPKEIIVKYIDNDGWGSAGTWRLLLDTFQMTNFGSQMGGTTNLEQATYLLLGNPSNSTTSFFNKAITITSTANPTGPANENARAIIYLTYFEITE